MASRESGVGVGDLRVDRLGEDNFGGASLGVAGSGVTLLRVDRLGVAGSREALPVSVLREAVELLVLAIVKGVVSG